VLEALDAQAVRRWYEWGVAALDASRDEINSLNVFPVPDGDTGTNLHLTLESAVKSPGDERAAGPFGGADLAATATEMARLSLLGARGSSGVILSQLLRGVAEVLAGQQRPPRGVGLARALERASALAYAAVADPVEGTMLTVARAAAEAAAATRSDDLHAVVLAAAGAAREALADTPSQLPVLERAGVVDAGGRGIVVLLEVLTAIVEQGPLPEVAGAIAHPRLDALDREPGPAYEVMYLLDADDDKIAALRVDLGRVGDSVVISGGGGLWNVHVHTDDAADAIRRGEAAGRARQIRIVPIAGSCHGAVVVLSADSPAIALRAALATSPVHVVLISPGVVGEICALGFCEVALLTLPESAAATRLIAQDLATRGVPVATLVAESAVQLLSAAAVHDRHTSLSGDADAMSRAIASTRHVTVRAQDDRFVALASGFDALVGTDPADLAVRMLDLLLTGDVELVTVVAATDLAQLVADRVRAGHAGLEVAQVSAPLDGVAWVGVE
jgi:fatty acid kinase